MLNLIKKLLNLNFYTSPLDLFLKKYDEEHPHLSASQRREKEKYQRVYNLRDKPSTSNDRPSFWSQF